MNELLYLNCFVLLSKVSRKWQGTFGLEGGQLLLQSLSSHSCLRFLLLRGVCQLMKEIFEKDTLLQATFTKKKPKTQQNGGDIQLQKEGG